MRKKSISFLKKDAWKWFSKYIRLRDALLTTGTKERVKCFTCDREIEIEKSQAGHFIDGRGASVLFHEDLVHTQCYGCNVSKSGNKDAYTPRMIGLYGLKKVEEFWLLKNEVHQWTQEELEGIRDEYKETYKECYKNN